MSERFLETKLLYCKHISTADTDDILAFSLKQGTGLERYIKRKALSDEINNLMRTYIVRDKQTNEIVSYFSLKAGLLSGNEKRGLLRMITRNVSFETTPGIELADFAINSQYIENHPRRKGIGLIIFHRFIQPIAEMAAELIGAHTLYLFALPNSKVIQRYHQYGFERLEPKEEQYLHQRLKPYYDKSCIFMYQNL